MVHPRVFHRSWSSKLSLLICCLSIAPLHAQTSAPASAPDSLQLYGGLFPMVDSIHVSRSSQPTPENMPSMLSAKSYAPGPEGHSVRMNSSISHFGLRGREKLADNLSAFFQVETGFSVPQNFSTAHGNRNTGVGLEGSWGTFIMGNWDSPGSWMHPGNTGPLRQPYAGDASLIYLTPGFNVPIAVTTLSTRSGTPADATFNRRQGNSLTYIYRINPGLMLRAYHALSEGEKESANGSRIKPSVTGVGGEYRSDKVVVRYIFQNQQDYFGLAWIGPTAQANPSNAKSTATNSSDSNHRFLARYYISPQWFIQGLFDRVEYTADGVEPGYLSRYQRNAYSFLTQFKHQQNTFWFNVGRADDGSCRLSGGTGVCQTSGLGATMWNAGWRYDLSKRTDLFAAVHMVKNQRSAQYGVFPRPSPNIEPGTRQTGFTLGIEHSF